MAPQVSEWLKETYTNSLWPSTLERHKHFPPVFGPSAFVAHVSGGLEELVAKEIGSWEDSCDVVFLQGKVCFKIQNEGGSIETLWRRLRGIESLGFLFWAAPPPEMPTEKELWHKAFRKLLDDQVLPRAKAVEKAWRKASGHSGEEIRFGAVVKRAGEPTKKMGLTSKDIGAWVGDFFNERLGWEVDLTAPDVTVGLHWSMVQVVLELGVRKSPDTDPLPHQALHPPMAWGMARLAEILPGHIVLDPMVGKAGTLLEAALLEPGASFVGYDLDEEQIEAGRENVLHSVAGRGSSIELFCGDGTTLPLGNESVDRVLCDLPFGRPSN